MSVHRVLVGHHLIEIQNNPITGKTIVRYDGRKMSQGNGLFASRQVFTIDEDGAGVTYEVAGRSGVFAVHFRVRRNGVTIFNSRQREEKPTVHDSEPTVPVVNSHRVRCPDCGGGATLLVYSDGSQHRVCDDCGPTYL